MHASSQPSDPDATDAEKSEVDNGADTVAETGQGDQDTETQDTAESDAAAEAFEHLARIRSGISEGVITPW